MFDTKNAIINIIVRIIILNVNPCSFFVIIIFWLAIMTRGIIHSVRVTSILDMWSIEHATLILFGEWAQ